MQFRRIMGPQGLGAAIREERLDQGLTQAQLASKARVSREWLSGVERGERAGAELSKILQVLSSLDMDLSLSPRSSREPSSPRSENPSIPPPLHTPNSTRLTTNEATRKALKEMGYTGASTHGISQNAPSFPNPQMRSAFLEAAKIIGRLSVAASTTTSTPYSLATTEAIQKLMQEIEGQRKPK